MVVLITGCRSGFGLLAAVACARAGHTVYAGMRDLSTAGPLRDAAGDLPVIPVQLDVCSESDRNAVLARIEAEHGALGGLVNNAGVPLGGALEDVSEAELRRLFEVNVFGLWALTQRALPAMRAAGRGHILQISSMAGRMAMPGLGAYAASKHALAGMTEAWRLELHPFGLRMVLVEPGPFKTDIFERNRVVAAASADPASPYAAFVSRMEEKAAKWTDKAGDPQEVADRIVSLLADPEPPARVPIGPTTGWRRALRWGLPDAAWERLMRRAIA